MSRFPPFDFGRARTYPLRTRKNKVTVEDFAALPKGDGFADFVESLPRILAGTDLRRAAAAVAGAVQNGKPVIWGLGGHVIKVGLAPVLIDLMERGAASLVAMNGSAMIHDLEVALVGATSEDVPEQLQQGDFGMAEETGLYCNRAAVLARTQGIGLGEALCRVLAELNPAFASHSILLRSLQHGVPVTGHLAIGTDITHIHPAASGEALGEATFLDFRILTSAVQQLDGGGVYINLGSAVLLPEIFLKAVSIVRNCGHSLRDFTTVNMDFIQHYRPIQNVVRRPVLQGGTGIALTGHHELMFPLLAGMIRQQIVRG
ncbi:MAG: hypothetical protein HYX74_07140 [Acidobacteria bacterium]|nr:hypothetical protein [Acidobacteriota bacterium]